jgi:hypothetical protein
LRSAGEREEFATISQKVEAFSLFVEAICESSRPSLKRSLAKEAPVRDHLSNSSPASVIATLRPGRENHVSEARRRALVAAIVKDHRRGQSRLYQSMLVAGFDKMLVSLRRRLGRPKDTDLDQTVLISFVVSLSSPSFSPAWPILSLRRATVKAIRASRGEHRFDGATDEFTDEGEGVDVFAHTTRGDESLTERVVRIIPTLSGIDEEIVRALTSNIADGEPLDDYVERVFSDRATGERHLIYQRIRHARTRVIAIAREELAAA